MADLLPRLVVRKGHLVQPADGQRTSPCSCAAACPAAGLSARSGAGSLRRKIAFSLSLTRSAPSDRRAARLHAARSTSLTDEDVISVAGTPQGQQHAASASSSAVRSSVTWLTTLGRRESWSGVMATSPTATCGQHLGLSRGDSRTLWQHASAGDVFAIPGARTRYAGRRCGASHLSRGSGQTVMPA